MWQGYQYFTSFEEGDEYGRHFRRSEDKEGQLILNENERAQQKAFYQLAAKKVAPNNNLLAVGEDFVGRRLYTLSFIDLSRGQEFVDKINGTDGNAVWSGDSNSVYYVAKDPETLRPFRVYRHILGQTQDEDELLYEERDDTFHLGIRLSKSKEFVLINCESTTTSECFFIPTEADNPRPQSVLNRVRGIEYQADHLRGKFYLLHNHRAKNFMISCFSQEGPFDLEKAETIVPHDTDVFREEFELLSDVLAVEERKGGRTQIRLVNEFDYGKSHFISFNEEAYTVYLHQNPEPDAESLRIGYTSLTTPPSVYDYHFGSDEFQLLKQVEVVGRFDPSNYVSERLEVKARDGEIVPVSLVYRKGFEKNGNAPLLLYGYGSYGISVDPYFSHARLSLLDRGFSFAIAHIRGGQEKGRAWYEEGKLKNKLNTFYDFIDVAEYLAEKKYTSPNHLYAMGGSAGGLLVGAVMNMRPDLFNGVVAQVPFVDVISTMLDASIPLTTGEYDEWGNPENEDFYRYILKYSPYDNVEAKDYPALLITSGYHDSQVQYWEPTKWAAKLRDMKTDENPLLLVTEMEAGHGGASGRFKRLKEVALEYAFLLKLEKITE
jgi:oligopeptidase B